MTIQYHPALGEARWCDFTGIAPGMVKRRLVVVVAPKACQRPGLTTAVPLSASSPTNVTPWQIRLDRDPYPLGTAPVIWAKCDMIGVVCFERLSGFYRRWNGKRQYQRMTVSASELRRIREGIVASLGLVHWLREPMLDRSVEPR